MLGDNEVIQESLLVYGDHTENLQEYTVKTPPISALFRSVNVFNLGSGSRGGPLYPLVPETKLYEPEIVPDVRFDRNFVLLMSEYASVKFVFMGSKYGFSIAEHDF